MMMETIGEWLAPYVNLPKEEVARRLETPPDAALGDAALPCFELARTRREAPQAIAAELSAAVDHPMLACRAVGAYLNVSLRRDAIASEWLRELEKPAFRAARASRGQRVVVDMSSPNIAKPFGIGHLRSTVIGNAIRNLLVADGYEVVRVNHLGDWGTQFGKMIAAFRAWGDPEQLQERPLEASLELYVRFHEEAERDPALVDEARAWFARLEQGDETALELWRFFVETSKREFRRIYDRLGVDFEYELGESFYNDKMPAAVERLRTAGLLEESDGALVVRLDDAALPPCIVVKSDGSSIYATRDVATASYRRETLGGDRLLYVVGAEQGVHFRQVFGVLEKLDASWSGRCEHVPFGLMRVEGKKMSTRKGRVVLLEDVLNEAVERARAIIAEKNPGLADRDAVAEAVGIGAIVFGDLKHDREGAIDFRLEDAVRFEGETGPYVQYTHARIRTLLSKAAPQHRGEAPLAAALAGDDAWALLKLLLGYPEAVRLAAERLAPSIVARYALEAAKAVNRFYHAERVLVDDPAEAAAKLRLCAAAADTLRDALTLLGVAAPERM
ncbi:arginine--tRNA ligase [Paenibacillus sp.]|uniref:arginine--tRNA ligase n=1 Tax=Paenibacillus sp. TaxID=58172 RepID=UPI002D6426D9|nr:arginine--tRNA ligase [Paenibacillus sp.]HZG56162.1 arginine--tRNA ligase [Paenibacillus sp.]